MAKGKKGKPLFGGKKAAPFKKGGKPRKPGTAKGQHNAAKNNKG
jgi:hypothetical protein